MHYTVKQARSTGVLGWMDSPDGLVDGWVDGWITVRPRAG